MNHYSVKIHYTNASVSTTIFSKKDSAMDFIANLNWHSGFYAKPMPGTCLPTFYSVEEINALAPTVPVKTIYIPIFHK